MGDIPLIGWVNRLRGSRGKEAGGGTSEREQTLTLEIGGRSFFLEYDDLERTRHYGPI